VKREERIVKESSDDDYTVKAINLCKKFPGGPTALRGSTFGIK
jgi:hypothetical protein